MHVLEYGLKNKMISDDKVVLLYILKHRIQKIKTENRIWNKDFVGSDTLLLFLRVQHIKRAR